MSKKKDGVPENVSYPKKGSHAKTITKIKSANGESIGTVFGYKDGTGQVAPHKKKD